MENYFKVRLDFLKENNLNLYEYVTLWYYYHIYVLEKSEEFKEKGISIIVPSDLNLGLEKKGYIKIIDDVINVRTKTYQLFEVDKKDLFHDFLLTFPIKTPSGRYLSPVNPDTVMGKKLRKKWDKYFSKNPDAGQKAIKVLQAEVDWRKKKMTQEYMHNAEAWLNQGDFEKYEYLLEEQKTKLNKIREDYE